MQIAFTIFLKNVECSVLTFAVAWYEEGVWGFPFQIRPHSDIGPPSLSILHMIPWNNPHGEIIEGHVWVGSTIQTSRKQNVSNMEDFKHK